MTLRWRLTLLYTAATAVLFSTAAFVAEISYRRGSSSLADRTLMRTIDEGVELIEAQKPFDLERLKGRLSDFSDSNGGLFLNLLAADGRILYQSDPGFPAPTLPDRGTSTDARVDLRTISLSKIAEVRLATVLVPRVSGGFWLQAGIPLPASGSFFFSGQAYAAGLFFLAIVGMLGWMGWYIAGRALAPVERIVRVAGTVSRGAIAERIPKPQSDDEIGRLVNVLNEMFDRIEVSVTKLRQFAANVSHQLKTPLTILRGETEVALRGKLNLSEAKSVLERNLAEMESLSEVVEDILAYSIANPGEAARITTQRLDAFLPEIARKAEVLAVRKSQTIVTKAEPLSASFDSRRLEQALLNVLDNAVKHTPPEGRIALQARRNGSQAVISVEDSGPGVPPRELPFLFDKGRSRTGTGLGLRMARDLVESFSGKIEISSPHGRGLLVRVIVPMGPNPGSPT